MPSRLPPHFVELLQDALLKSYWRKDSLRSFLRRSHISDAFIGSLSDGETKRDWLNQLFPRLEKTEKGQSLLQKMARSLAEQETFPDLLTWEDSAEKIRDAKNAVKALKEYLDRKEQEKRDEKEVAQKRRAAEERRQEVILLKHTFQTLRSRLDELCLTLGTQQSGYDFQKWFYELMSFADIDHRSPYSVDGRQIDGSITIDGTTYLVELKFTADQASATAIDSIKAKVDAKADNTMGIILSMSGFSKVAISQASYPKSPLLLLDANHLYFVLGEVGTFHEMIRRVRRHSSQEGAAYLAVADFGK